MYCPLWTCIPWPSFVLLAFQLTLAMVSTLVMQMAVGFWLVDVVVSLGVSFMDTICDEGTVDVGIGT